MKSAVVAVLALASVGTALAAGATSQPRAALATVYSKCTVPKTVALTFDDGTDVYGYDIAKTIEAAGGKATFFVNANNYGCIYDAANQKRLKWLYDRGHQIASHTNHHLYLTSLSFDQLHDEFWQVEQALQRIIGAQPAFVRPPFGEYNDLTREVAKQRGQDLVIWDLDTGDSLGESVAYSKSIYDQAVSKNPSTILALNHETIETTAHQVVPYAVNLLKSKGYKFVTVAECLGRAPYQWTAAPQTPSSSWQCT